MDFTECPSETNKTCFITAGLLCYVIHKALTPFPQKRVTQMKKQFTDVSRILVAHFLALKVLEMHVFLNLFVAYHENSQKSQPRLKVMKPVDAVQKKALSLTFLRQKKEGKQIAKSVKLSTSVTRKKFTLFQV